MFDSFYDGGYAKQITMRVFQTISETQKHLLKINVLQKKVIGFVPTMGALHEGHISLIKACKAKTDVTVSSIFVNPTQFNDKKDFEKYPIQLDKDLEMLLEAGCDIVFVPNVEEIYPNGTLEKTEVNLGFIGKTLDAEHRPGHFEGVLQVVKRLLDIVQPDVLFLGQKDYQQCMVLNKLVEHYHLPVKIEICDTLREKDGLAMSSRNMRLNTEERASAVKLSQAIFYIKENIQQKSIPELIQEQTAILATDELIKLEYLIVVNGKTLEPVDVYEAEIPLTVLVAAKVGLVRLIDNVIIQ
ncbi:MAG TPA: pantoate--beta-alanine ligase [Chitinophagales bacterium]|nr:pantoate--beta-alanine ligase [Chitinophagales bacterium]